MEFGKRLRQARMNKQMTQQELSDLIHISLRNYQSYEQGVRRPKYETLVDIADNLGVTIDWLLDRSHEASADEH